ncbi:MAG TPA: hypothetical protein PK413_02385 [Thermoanaerobaculia bacterium]|nr:hypothetical protein [Thermoanaerobaculia bacterium]
MQPNPVTLTEALGKNFGQLIRETSVLRALGTHQEKLSLAKLNGLVLAEDACFQHPHHLVDGEVPPG